MDFHIHTIKDLIRNWQTGGKWIQQSTVIRWHDVRCIISLSVWVCVYVLLGGFVIINSLLLCKA